MPTLQESMQNMRVKNYTRVKRNDKAYRQCEEWAVVALERLLKLYRNNVVEDDMQARLWRDDMDKAIRRYQEYAIQGRIKSHYNQSGVSLAAKDVTFEHVIPLCVVRDLLIDGKITIQQAINMPTCRVSKKVDKALREASLHDSTPDGWTFFKRYQLIAPDIEIKTFNGKSIDNLDTWTLEDHYRFFNVVEE
jgi:hypothetical protein